MIYATRGWSRAVVALVLAATFLPAARPLAARAHSEPEDTETRGLWVTRSSMVSPSSIAAVVRTARTAGFNTLLVQVRGRGDAYYAGQLEPRATDLARQPASFDPLATLLTEARASKIRVHAWVAVNLVSSAAELPSSPDHVVYRHPEWLMVPRPIAQEVAKLDPGNPAYVGKIARWTRGESDKVEGLFASPLQPDAAAYTERVITDIARRYDLDGIHLDYVRYPNAQFDYSRFAIAEFRASMRPRLSAEARRDVDAQEAVDLFAYPDRFPAEWAAFRRERLTAMVSFIRQSVRTVRPTAVVTAAVYPDPQEAYDVRLQDWRGWVTSHLVDAVAPMAYTPEPARFAEQIAAVRDLAGGRVVWAGIGAYRLTPAQTIENIQAARRIGTAGFVLFSYDSLTGPNPPAADYLGTVSRAAFATTRATSNPEK